MCHEFWYEAFGMSKQVIYLPLEKEWDIKIGSARELFRTLHDYLDKYGYEHNYEPIKDEHGAIDGTATFYGSLRGKKDTKTLNLIKLCFGIVLFVWGVVLLVMQSSYVGGGILVLLGIIVAITSKFILRMIVELSIEGETYRAKGTQSGDNTSEVYDVGLLFPAVLIVLFGLFLFSIPPCSSC
jgi:hypothetical protein